VELFKQAGLDFEALKKQAQSKSFRAVPLKGVTMSANYRVAHETVVSKNVAGLLPGTKRPNETVVYTAHWDHLGIGKPDETGDRIFNGAVDNATGVAAVLELARLFSAAPKPERSVLFLAVTAEEKGLLGSEYYATHPLYPLETTVADINMDSLGTRGATRDFGTQGANTWWMSSSRRLANSNARSRRIRGPKRVRSTGPTTSRSRRLVYRRFHSPRARTS
jgi:Zn-dependent M28 family amino/carboxypeptidase